MKEPLVIEYDQAEDVVTIEGVKYSGDVFRGLGVRGLPDGTAIRIEKRQDGQLHLRRLLLRTMTAYFVEDRE